MVVCRKMSEIRKGVNVWLSEQKNSQRKTKRASIVDAKPKGHDTERKVSRTRVRKERTRESLEKERY